MKAIRICIPEIHPCRIGVPTWTSKLFSKSTHTHQSSLALGSDTTKFRLIAPRSAKP